MKRIAFAIVVLIWMGVIFYASSLPGTATGPNTPLWTFFLKTLHFVNFGVLALLFLALLKGKRRLADIGLTVFLISLLFTIVYAMSDEYHQKFSPGRHPAVKDVVIDMLGASSFLAASFVLRKKPERKKEYDRWKNC